MKRNGFSLFELLIAVLLSSVLFTVSVPLYTDYVRKARLQEMIKVLRADQDAIADYITFNGMPSNSTQATNMITEIGGLSYCVNSNFTGCSFDASGLHVTLSGQVANPSFEMLFYPVIISNNLKWYCGNAGGVSDTSAANQVRDKLFPEDCRQALTSALSTASISYPLY